MTDTLAARVGRIVAGSAHALVDAIEGTMPDAVLQQTLREIDKAIDEVRTELGRAIAEKHLAGKRLAEQSSRHEELTGHVELALEQNREDLARAAIERQLDVEAQVPVLEATAADAGRRETELEGYVAALTAKRREMEDAFTAMRQTRARAAEQAGADPVSGEGPGLTRRVDNATNTFDRMMLREGAPGTGGVDRGLDGRVAALDKLARDHRIEERLAAIKARVTERPDRLMAFLLSGDNVPFVAALVLMLLIGAVEAAGLGGGIGDSADAELDAEGPSLLSWLNLGRLPLLMLIVVFLFSFGIVGLIGQQLLAAIVGQPAPWLLAVPVALAAALPVTRVFGKGVSYILPKDETQAVSRDSLVGRLAVIVTGDARPGSAAQARVRDQHGQSHYVMVEPDDADDAFAQGASVLLVRHVGATYFAISNPSASLLDGLE